MQLWLTENILFILMALSGKKVYKDIFMANAFSILNNNVFQ